MRKALPLLFILCFGLPPLAAQNTFEEFRAQKRAEFDSYRNSKRKAFDEYRAQKNREFADYLAGKWVSYNLRKGVPQPKQPDPATPVIAPKEVPVTTPPAPQPIQDIVPIAVPTVPKPIDFPVNPAPQPDTRLGFTFYGTACKVYFRPEMKFQLGTVNEKNVCKTWKLLSDEHYTLLLADCRQLHETMQLNDFGLLRLAETVARKTLGSGNEAVVLQTYIMTQFGYDVRMCQQGNKLGMMIPYRQTVCNVPYYRIDGMDFYLSDMTMKDDAVNSYKQNMKDATRQIDLYMTATPRFATALTAAQTYRSEAYPEAAATTQVNKNLMTFYNDYPMTNEWGTYAAQPMDPQLTARLYPPLKAAIQGKSETEAVGILLNFVQTAFDYETDTRQFGKEKYNFGEENFFYPACDCEDRSILFAQLVRELTGLDVVLLHYPNHLATAVCFNSTVSGTYLNINGKRYTLCDPTYINARIGMCMTQYQGVKPTVCLIPRQKR